MPGYVLTGAPGAGKTAILRALERAGQRVVEEAATDVIALQQALGSPAPEYEPRFLEQIVCLQRARQQASPAGGAAVFFDRSPVCTLALARYAGLPVPRAGLRRARFPADGRAARTSAGPGRPDRRRRRPARATAGRVTFRRVCRR
jgi:predicted ATPase